MPPSGRDPVRWTGVLFPFALNLLVTSAGIQVLRLLQIIGGPPSLLVLCGAIIAGSLAALYVGRRAGIHVFLGGMLSIPVLALVVIPGSWGFALLSGALCAVGGLLTERLWGRNRVR